MLMGPGPKVKQKFAPGIDHHFTSRLRRAAILAGILIHSRGNTSSRSRGMLISNPMYRINNWPAYNSGLREPVISSENKTMRAFLVSVIVLLLPTSPAGLRAGDGGQADRAA